MIAALLSHTIAAAFVAAPATVPPLPTSPALPAFAAQVSGRAALSDAWYAVVTAPVQNFAATWRFVTFDETEKISGDSGGRETFALDRPRRRLSLVATSKDGKSAVHFVAGGDTLLCARLVGGKRTFSRIPLQGDTRTLRNALLTADADRFFMGAVTRTTLFGDLNDATMRYPGMVYAAADKSVVEILHPQDDNGHRKIIVRRYRFAPRSARILSREEWATWQDAGKPVLLRSYWRDAITHKTGAFAPATFAATPAPGYTEVPPPAPRELPLPPGPDTCDARARPLLTRWIRAVSRFVSLDARLLVSQGVVQQTPESAPTPADPQREAVYDFQYKRPGKLRFLVTPDNRRARETPNLWGETLLAVGDGKTVAVFDGDKTTHRRGEFALNSDDGMVWYALYRAGFWDFGRILPCYFWIPQAILDDTESATYRGTLPLPGGDMAEAVTLNLRYSSTGGRRKGRPGSDVTTSTNTITLFFDDKTGLPRRVEQFIRHFPADGTTPLRDVRPNETFVATTTRLTVNAEPPQALFSLPDTPL